MTDLYNVRLTLFLPPDWWLKCLPGGRKDGVERIYDYRRQRNEEIELANCMQICDKKKIVAVTEGLLKKTGFSTAKEWNSFMDELEPLRNNLAHANEIDTGSWPEKAELVLQIEDLIGRLEDA